MALFTDSECSVVFTQTEAEKGEIIRAINANIAETTCNADAGNYFKERVYCESPSNYVAKHYNIFNEDPNCLRAYPDDAIVYPTLSFSDGECVAWGTKGRTWIKITIVAN